jgi:hypothetical protein
MPIRPASVHVDSALSSFAVAYRNNGFIADRLSPIISTDKRSGKYFIRNRRDVSHAVSDLLGPKSKANEAYYDVTTGNYSVEDRGLVGYVGAEEESNADAPLDPRQLQTQHLMQQIMLNRELRVATQFCTAANYGGNTAAAGGGVWTNETSSTPIADINTAMAAIPFSGEDTEFVAFMSRPVWNALRKHPSILSLKGVSSGQVSRSEFAAYFELNDVLVSDVWYDTANIGQTASYARGFTSTVFGVVRVPRMITGAEVSIFGATFRSKPGLEVRTWDEPSRGKGGSEAIQVEMSDDEVIVQSDMGYLLTSVA